VKEAFAAWLTAEVGQPVTIGWIERASYGFSRENWLFDATWAGQTHALIARRDPPGSVLRTDRRIETAVLDALERSAVPVPTLRWVDLTGRWAARPCLVMDRVQGTCQPLVLNSDRSLAQRVAVAERIYDQLAAIHGLDWRALGLGDRLEIPSGDAPGRALEHWTTELRAVQREPEPELALVRRWLGDHLPRSTTTTLVHGDFKPGNVLLDADDRVTAVLDWETAHLGDPHEDLGWVTNPLRAGEHRIAGSWEPADLVHRWATTTGIAVDHDALRWWQILANYKLAVIVLTGVGAFHDGLLERIHQQPVGIYRLLMTQLIAAEK